MRAVTAEYRRTATATQRNGSVAESCRNLPLASGERSSPRLTGAIIAHRAQTTAIHGRTAFTAPPEKYLHSTSGATAARAKCAAVALLDKNPSTSVRELHADRGAPTLIVVMTTDSITAVKLVLELAAGEHREDTVDSVIEAETRGYDV